MRTRWVTWTIIGLMLIALSGPIGGDELKRSTIGGSYAPTPLSGPSSSVRGVLGQKSVAVGTSTNAGARNDQGYFERFVGALLVLDVSSDRGGNPVPTVGPHFYVDGTYVNTRVDSIVSGGGYTWFCAGWWGTGSVPPMGADNNCSFYIHDTSSIDWRWVRTDLAVDLLVRSAHGNPMPIRGTTWWEREDVIHAEVEDSAVSGGWTYYCTGWTGTGDAPTVGYGHEVTFTINTHSEINWHWVRSDSLVKLTVESDHDTPVPPVGLTRHARAEFIHAQVDSLVPGFPSWLCLGWEGFGSAPARGYRHEFNFTIMDSTNIEWLWADASTVVPLDVTSAYDTPQPPNGRSYFPVGGEVVARVDSQVTVGGVVYTCMGYYGTGDAPVIGFGPRATFTITEASTITWVWARADQMVPLTVVTPFGSPTPPLGTHYWLRDAIIYAWVDSTVWSGGVEYLCQGWLGSGNAPGHGWQHEFTFSIHDSSSIDWQWIPAVGAVWLDVATPYGIPDPPMGRTYFAPGTEVTATAQSPVTVGGITYVCVGWTGTGDVPAIGYGETATFTIASNSSITWQYEDIRNTVLVTVVSPYGPTSPPVGTVRIRIGTLVTFSCEEDHLIDVGNRWQCIGWTATSPAPTEGDSTRFIHTVTAPITVTWEWTHQFMLFLTYAGTGAAIPGQAGQGWYSLGDTVRFSTDPVCGLAPNDYGFMTWSTDYAVELFSPEYFPDNGFIMDTSRTMTAHYGPAVSGIVQKSPAENYGHIFIDGRAYYNVAFASIRWARNSFHRLEVTTPDVAGPDANYTFMRWSYGATAAMVEIGPITGDTTFTAIYNQAFRCMVVKNPPQELGNITVDGTVHYNADTVEVWLTGSGPHVLSVTTPDSTTDRRFAFTNWTDGPTTPSWTVTTLIQPTVFTANYVTQWPVNLVKSPPEPYGYFMVNSIRYNGASARVWVTNNVTLDIEASASDIHLDSVYSWQSWSDFDAIRHVTTPITGGTTFTAFYIGDTVRIGLDISPNAWYIQPQDSPWVNADTVVNMTYEERMVLTNLGNVPITIGLQTIDTAGYTWRPAMWCSIDYYRLRARLEDRADAPPASAYSSQGTVLRSLITWANGTNMGPGGNPLQFSNPYIPGSDPDVMLFLQFQTPTFSEFLSQIVRVRATARVYMP